MTSTSRLKRCVWVMDIHDYLLYLEDCLYRISFQFPWLAQTQPVDKHWPWTETDRFLKDKTQRDHLIDWLLCRIISDVYYFDTGRKDSHPEYEQILSLLTQEYHLVQQTRSLLYIPKIFGDIYTYHILRQSCWLYIEAEIDVTQQPR